MSIGATGGICTVPDCDTIVADAHVCSMCAHRLSIALGDVGDVMGELETELTRQGRRGGRVGGRSSEVPLPFDVSASIVADALASTLSTWARVVWGDVLGAPAGLDDAEAAAAFLADRVEEARHRPDGGALVDEVTAAVEAARDQVHDPGDSSASALLGLCPDCGQALYGRETVREARCRRDGCDGVVDSAEWRYDALQRLTEAVLPAVDVARAASLLLGADISAARVRQWRRRGRLDPVDPDADRPHYRVSDIRQLLMADKARLAG
ncbi:hypothetical protein [Nocardiopsis oceani]